MHAQRFHPHRAGRVWPHRLPLVSLTLLVLLTPGILHAADIIASNKRPLSFGPGQTLIDLKQIVWEPLKGEGIPPGARIATLHGDLAAGGGELLVYLPRTIRFPTTVIRVTSSTSGSRATLPILRPMARRRRSADTPTFGCRAMCRTPCGVGKRPACFTSAIRDPLITKFIRCPRARSNPCGAAVRRRARMPAEAVDSTAIMAIVRLAQRMVSDTLQTSHQQERVAPAKTA